jgi:carboxyl-terminal processing protease
MEIKIREIWEKFKKAGFVIFAVLIIGGAFVSGTYFGYNNRPAIEKVVGITHKETLKPTDVDFSPFWQAWEIVNKKFVSRSEIDNQKLVYGAIEGMVNALGDPYSVFFPPAESKMFQEDMSGNFSGVGMEIGIRNGILTVISPLKGTPAYNAGIKAGDKIIKIGDKITTDLMSDEAARLIRGERGTEVTLTILRDKVQKPLEIKIVRDTIKVPVIDTESKGNGIFVIKMYSFSATSATEFRGALRKFIESGDKKLILDLRNNPGGYLDASIDMASYFLQIGKVVVKEKFADGTEEIYRSKGYGAVNKLPMIILVNEGSASASEILAGALQEHGIAKLVGTKTFGKGSVQEMVPVTGNTSLKITIAKWLTPNGRSISDLGLEPDVKVEITEKDAEKLKDTQLEKAIEMLK